MNQVTHNIAKLLGSTLEEALKVQQKIEADWLLDFSECSTRQFNKVVRSIGVIA
jgi:hypothetical protein|tara:strand:+ start:12744 stop:12905 length:162 start_codon:yes stop_codon:yes gene_type:complete